MLLNHVAEGHFSAIAASFNLRVHHAKLVKAWLAKHQDEIEVFICRVTTLS